MHNSLTWKGGKGGLRASWSCTLPLNFNILFREICQVYYHSAAKSKNIWLQQVSPPMEDLLKKYYSVNAIGAYFRTTNLKPFDHPRDIEDPKMDDDLVTIMFTGGKDSLHALLSVLKTKMPEKIQCIYITNINKSESIYERKAIEEICNHLGVSFKIVNVSNSVPINRDNHNIGLRDQLLLVLALPYIADFRSGRVVFGLHDAFRNITTPALFTSHNSAFGYVLSRLQDLGIKFKVEEHPGAPTNEVQITKDLLTNHPELFWMTNFCCRQTSLREKQHARFKERHPDFKIYNGCGNCLKCARTNGILAMFESSGSEAARWNLAKDVNNMLVLDFKSDNILRGIVLELRSNILKAE